MNDLKIVKNGFGSKLSNISSEKKPTENVFYHRLAERGLARGNFPEATNGMECKGDTISGAASFSRRNKDNFC